MPAYGKRSLPILPVIIVIAVLSAVIVFLVVKMSLPAEDNVPVISEEEVSSEIESEETPSVVTQDDTKGDIIFIDGVGYDLLSVINKNYLMNIADGLPDLVTLTDDVTAREGGNYMVDARVAEPLENMLTAARSAGYIPIVWSAYRTYEYQSRLYESAIASFINSNPGSTREDAIAAVTDTAPPGSSEHCTGLSVDIYTWRAHSRYGKLSQEFKTDPLAQWLASNAHYYGFIVRYPEGKEDITMIGFEPWHFRYVGIEAATEIYEQGLTLEEYTGKLG